MSHPTYHLPPTEIEGIDWLAELALDMRWAWNHATDDVWRQLEPDLSEALPIHVKRETTRRERYPNAPMWRFH
jgi:hypothetical protein